MAFKRLKKHWPKTWRGKIALSLVLLLGGIGLLVWWHYELTTVVTEEWTIGSPRIPVEFNDYRIAVLSDLHGTPFELEVKIAEQLRAAKPDVIFCAGDLIYKFVPDIKYMIDVLEDFNRIAPVVAVLGNHDAWGPHEAEMRTQMQNSSLIYLDEQSINLERNGAQITVFGSDRIAEVRRDNYDTSLMESAFATDNYKILLTHWPDIYFYLKDDAAQFDLQVAGHYHGGQIRLPGGVALLALLSTKTQAELDGIMNVGDKDILTTRGLGVGNVPIRTFCKPQILLLTLKNSATRYIQRHSCPAE